MIKLFRLLLVFVMLSTLACELKRSNPLDPESNPDVIVPPKVTGLLASGSGPGITSKYVDLTWDKNPIDDTDGYFIYMSLSYNSDYKRVGMTGNVSPDMTIRKTINHNIAAGYYYFKVSAYKVYADTLIGSPSEYIIAHVDN